MENSMEFMNTIISYNELVGRFLTKGKQEKSKDIIKKTNKYYQDNKKRYPFDVILQSLEILITNYGEVQYKFGTKTDIGSFITEYLNSYIKERKDIIKNK